MGAAAAHAAVGIGLGLDHWRVPTWWRAGAILDVDFTTGRFNYSGRNYAGKEAFLAAVGGSEASGAIAIGPHDVPGAAERVSNGDFSAGTAGWTAYALAGAPIFSAAGGVALLHGNGANNPGFSQPIMLDKGHAYRLRTRIRTIDQQPSVMVAHAANMTGETGVLLSDLLPTLHERDSTFSAEEAALYVGTRQFADPCIGSSEFDDVSVKPVQPFPGFEQAGFAAIVAGTTPVAPSGEQVIIEWSDGALNYLTPSESNCVRLVWDATKHLRLVVRAKNAEQVNLDLGMVDVSTAFELLLSLQADTFRAALADGPVELDTAGELPGIAMLFLKRQNDAGSTFEGSLDRLTLFPAPWTGAEFLARQESL